MPGQFGTLSMLHIWALALFESPDFSLIVTEEPISVNNLQFKFKERTYIYFISGLVLQLTDSSRKDVFFIKTSELSTNQGEPQN